MTQQPETVAGTVLDQSGLPIIGANILIIGTTTGTITDFDGRFELSVLRGERLQVSYIGFLTQEVDVNASALNIVLLEDSKLLTEVVVVGYGTMQKKQVTSSISSLSAQDLTIGVGGASIVNALQGKVSGLVMSGSGSPNSTNTLQLRGMASVNTSRSPLVVIDGMPGGDIRSVVQEDIESINVLKDASAGAIYGTRATGGVILITTKKAKEGDMQVSYTGEVLAKQAFGKPDLLSAEEYIKHKLNNKPDDPKNYHHPTDWWDEALNDNPTSQRHVLTLQGGSPNARIYTTLMYENNRGVLVGDERTDYGGRINGHFKVLDGWLDVLTHVDFRQAKRDQAKPSVTQLLNNNPTRSPYDPQSPTGFNIWTSELDDYNTIADAKQTTDEGIDKWFRPDVELKLNILPIEGLTFHQTFAYENRQWEHHFYRPMSAREEISNGRQGTATLEFSKTELLNSDGYFSFIKDYGLHSLNATFGYSYFEQNGEGFKVTNFNFANDLVRFWDIGKGTYLGEGKAEMSSSKEITQRLVAGFARASYSFNDTYMATVSYRREGSSKFAVDNRWGNFYSLSVGWRLSKEDFLKEIEWVNDLKLRLGYGVTGNEGFSADYAATMYGSDTYWLLPNGQWAYSYGVTKNINYDLGWEEKHEWNAGLDYSLFHNRLYGKFDLYQRNVEGLIYEVNVPQPPYTESKMFKNIGTLENRGWEFEIGADLVRTKDWQYSTSLNLAHNATTVGSLGQANTFYNDEKGLLQAGHAHRLEENVTVGSFHIFKFADFDDNGDFLLYNKAGEVINAKDYKEEDRQYIGNYMPVLMAGWTHSLIWKNWSFGMTLTSWIDFDIYNTLNMYYGLPSGSFNVLKDAYGKNAHIKGQKVACDYFLEDGTFLKIQNVSLGYSLDTRKYLKVVDKLRLYLSVNNLATFSGYSGLNPEVNITGWDQGLERYEDIYPQTRTWTLGMQLNF
ncbi:MAG: SusC/RagA family TonB-linked outer membrane protein [Tannerellaceae bacterium]|nr:SusC/RagA family TonB-linked outer membrane protein [Tannerellaceae bacterium]